MKQTAVEWFFDKIKSHFENDGDLLETLTFTTSIAKEKEKQQIETAYDAGMAAGYSDPSCSETYYNETFKTKES